MEALFVHGMGRSPASGWPLTRRLRRAGVRASAFAYVAAAQDFQSIKLRLIRRIETLAARGPYVLIGHSLGGILLRAALGELAPSVRRPAHLFLLGSPVSASRLAAGLRTNRLFRFFSGDCGQLLASHERMAGVAPSAIPTTAVAGVKGFSGRHPFGGEPNDGIVALSEVTAPWLADRVLVPVVHTLLPSSGLVAGVILDRLRRHAA